MKMAKKNRAGWQPDSLIGCPCCQNEYETNDHVPFSPRQYDLYAAAPELLAALKAITPHAWGHSTPGCKGKARDPENCDVCKSIWAARDAIAKAEGR